MPPYSSSSAISASSLPDRTAMVAAPRPRPKPLRATFGAEMRRSASTCLMMGNDRSNTDHVTRLPVEQEGLRARRLRVGRQVERIECQRGVDQRTLAGEVEHQRAGCLVAVDHDLGVLDGEGVPRPIDLPLDGAALRPSAVGTGTPNQRAARRRLGRRELGLPGELQILGDIEVAIEARLQQVALQRQLHRPARRRCACRRSGRAQPSNASRWPRIVKLPWPATWPLRRPVSSAWMSLIVSELRPRSSREACRGAG